MKAKFFSILMLFVAVSLFGFAEAQSPSDATKLIEIVDEASTEAASVADAEVSAELQSVVNETRQHVGNFLPDYSGDIDHQIIIICARENTTAGLAGCVPYRPRSNLNYSGYEV